MLKKTSLIMDELLLALQSAKTEILFQTFYIDNDSVFKKFTDILVEKARAGVHVLCLFDALGSKHIFGTEVEQTLRDAGVHLEYFNWLTPWSTGNKKVWYFRNHKRALILDREVLYTGGWCIGERALDWVDAYICSRDKTNIADALIDFKRMYTYAHRGQLKFRHEKKYVYMDTALYSYSYQAPLLRARYIYYTFRRLIQNAKKDIVLMAPYFVPTHNLFKSIKKAKERGVRVRIFVPKKTDHTLVDIAARGYFEALLSLGVEVYLTNELIHAKIAIWDDVLFCGTMNLDTISIRYNFENGIFTHDEKEVKDTLLEIDEVAMTSEHISLDTWQKRSLWKKIIEYCVRPLRPFL